MAVNISKVKTPCKIRKSNERISDFSEIVLGYSKEEALNEAARCLNCKNPTCITGCPASNNIPLFINYIKEDNLEEAYKALRLTSNMPEICSRVCDQAKQCEKNCIRAKNGEAVSIGLLERYITDNVNSKISAEPQYFSKNVAIIGSGPAGLSCAEELAKLGYLVTIFEAENEFGGLLTYGIPNYRLPYEIVKNKIQELKNLKVVFKNNSKLGKDFSIEDLKYAGFAAILIGIGASKPKFMGIPEEDATGVFTSNEFLWRVCNVSKNIDKGLNTLVHGKVAVIGGGNSAIDAARSALRIDGVESVEIIYRRTRKSMPAAVIEVEDAIKEGVILNDLTLPTEIIKENNKIKAIKCVKMYETEVGTDGRRSVKPIEGSEFIKDVDCLIYAIGNDVDDGVESIKEVTLSKWKTIETDEFGQASNEPLIFAAGDVASGPATVVKAMSAGKRAANKIHELLNEK